MVTRRLERILQAGEHPVAIMFHQRGLAVHELLRAHDLTSEYISDTLVTKANTKNWGVFAELPHHVAADPRLLWSAWSRRDADLLRGQLRNLF